MILLLDIGNSRSKAAWFDGQRILPVAAVDACVAMDGLVDRVAKTRQVPERIGVSNVRGPRVAHDLRSAARARWELDPEFAVTQPESGGLQCGYVDHRQLGIDRWLAMLAARRRYPAGSLCIVDAGTAVTVDLVDPDGGHCGGFIVPGIPLMIDALRQRSAGIARFDANTGAVDDDAGPGRSTSSAVTAGALQAIAGLVDRAVALLPVGSAQLLLTGGHAECLLRLLGRAEICPGLVFEGLLIALGLEPNLAAMD